MAPQITSSPVLEPGPGWGCSCRACHPHYDAASGLARSVDVTAQLVDIESDGTIHFLAWSDPTDKHSVTFSPNATRSAWCKHIAACLGLLSVGRLRNGLLAILPGEPTICVMDMGTETSHWLRPQTTKTLCGVSLLNGHPWQPAQAVSCQSCANIRREKGGDTTT